MDITGFDKVAQYLTHPLVLVGFVLMLVFGIHSQLMKSGLLSQVSKKDSNLIIRLFFRYGFWLGLVLVLAMFLLQFSGIGLSAWNSWMEKEKVQAVNARQVAEKLLAPLQGQLQAKDEQIKALTEAITALSKTGAPAASINAALQELEQGNTAKAKAIFAEVAAANESAGKKNNQEAAEAYRHLGALAYMNDTKAALAAYQKATELDPDNAVGWNWLGCVLSITGELAQAEEAFRKVLTLGEAHQNKKEQAWAFGNLGLVYEERGELNNAEEMHRKALVLNESAGSEEDMAANYGNLGNVHWRRGALDNAEQMYRKAFTLAEALGDKEGMAADYTGLGNVYQTRGDLDKAEEMYKKSLEIDQSLGNKDSMTVDYGNLGVIYKTQGELDKAEEMYKKSLKISKALGLKGVTADQYVNLGLLYVKRGNLAQTEELWKKSLSLYQEMGHPNAKMIQQGLDELAQQKAGSSR